MVKLSSLFKLGVKYINQRKIAQKSCGILNGKILIFLKERNEKSYKVKQLFLKASLLCLIKAGR
jgi:hypothetical protein